MRPAPEDKLRREEIEQAEQDLRQMQREARLPACPSLTSAEVAEALLTPEEIAGSESLEKKKPL